MMTQILEIVMKSFKAVVLTVFLAACGVVCQPLATTVAQNIAEGKTSYQSTDEYSNEGGAHLAVDGNFNQYWSGKSCSHTSSQLGAYWEVDLGEVYLVEAVRLYNKMDTCCNGNLAGAEVHFGMTRDTCRLVGYNADKILTSYMFEISPPVSTRWVRISRSPDVNSPLVLCEVAVNGYKTDFRMFKRISDVIGTGDVLETKYARSTEHCCYICFVTQDCLAVTMDNSQCSLLNSDKSSFELGQTLYIMN